MTKLQLKDKQVLVLGLGKTGLSVARWLEGQGALLSVADTRLNPPGLEELKKEIPAAKVHLGELSQQVVSLAEVIVISPGISVKEPLVQDAISRGIPVVGDVELFAQFKSEGTKVIAITGSNGKTTVTTLAGEICKAAGLKTIVAGNIGLPVLEALAMPVPDVYVLELSSFQLETTRSLNADAATMLNLSEDHLDRHDGMDEYASVKAAVFNGAGVQVLNSGDDYSMNMAQEGRKQILFGLCDNCQLDNFCAEKVGGDVLLKQGRRHLLNLSETKLFGLHNAFNALSAMALCYGIGIKPFDMVQVVKDFKGLPHRVQWVDAINEVDFYDDSKGTNVGATCAAVAGISQKVVLIAGGEGKGQDFSPLRAPISQNARAVVLIGRDAALIERELLSTEVPIYHAVDLPEAVAISLKVAKAKDAVLLSPACASFDMFDNYEHRSAVFVDAIGALSDAVSEAAL